MVWWGALQAFVAENLLRQPSVFDAHALSVTQSHSGGEGNLQHNAPNQALLLCIWFDGAVADTITKLWEKARFGQNIWEYVACWS